MPPSRIVQRPGLLTDMYHPDSAYVSWRAGLNGMTTFELFARPALRRMHGHDQPFRRPVRVRLAESVTIGAPLLHLLRAVVVHEHDGPVARLTGPQGSGLLTSMARANALLIVPAERQRVDTGEFVDAIMLRDEGSYSSDPPA